MAIIKCPLEVHYAAIQPTGRIHFLVCRKMLSPAGKLSLLANVFTRVQRARKGCPISARLGIRTLVAWLLSTCKGAVPTAFLHGPFFFPPALGPLWIITCPILFCSHLATGTMASVSARRTLPFSLTSFSSCPSKTPSHLKNFEVPEDTCHAGRKF